MTATRPHFNPTANLPEHKEGKPAFSEKTIVEYRGQAIDKQAKLTQAEWRTCAYVLVKRANEYARSFTKKEAGDIRHLMTAAGIAYDKVFKPAGDEGVRGPAHVLIGLFGTSGVGEAIAHNLSAMIPKAKVIDVTPTPANHQATGEQL